MYPFLPYVRAKGCNAKLSSRSDQSWSFFSLPLFVCLSVSSLTCQSFRLALCCKWLSKVYPKMKVFFSPNYIYVREVTSFRHFYLKLLTGLYFSIRESPKKWIMNDPKQTTLEQFCILYAKKCSHNKVTKWMSLCLNRGIKLNCDKSKLFKGSLVRVYQITLNIMCWTKALIPIILCLNGNILRKKPTFLL